MHYLHETQSQIEIAPPITTYETTLFHSVGRGAKISRLAKTLTTTVLSDMMTRSILFEARSAHEAHQVLLDVQSKKDFFQEQVVSKQSNYAHLKQIDGKIVGNLLYIRLGYETGNASGHNMTTFASDKIAEAILALYPTLQYVSVSGNFCTDKKVSSVNSILGRGKHVIAEILIPRDIVEKSLRTTPEKIVDLNIKKNLIGSIASGGLLSANAHYANMLLAFYLATGQDAANIVEGSQGITHCEVRNDDLYFSVSLPNIIVGSVGHGKDALDANKNLESLDVKDAFGAQKLAQIAAALVLCGELSLMAALTNTNELTQSHKRIERKQS
jgi:hydroxymethylglutaryl-CoA reductase (NADPH)